MEQTGEKTEQPTVRRLKEARKKGRVFSSKDLSFAALFFVFILIMFIMHEHMGKQLLLFFRFAFREAINEEFTVSFLSFYMKELLRLVFNLASPFWLSLAVASVVIIYLQAGPTLSFSSLQPQLKRLDPLQGAKRMFSWKSLVEIFKALVKINICSILLFWLLKNCMNEVILSMHADERTLVLLLEELSTALLLRIAVILLLLAVVDYFYQKWLYKRELQMTKAELKQEYKQTEGDPNIKAKRKHQYEEIAMHSMLEEVKKADICIVNPAEIAVALKYDHRMMNAPRVVAKGRAAVARKIKEAAILNSIPVLENVILAHALIKVRLGGEVPEELYETLAELVALVFNTVQGAL